MKDAKATLIVMLKADAAKGRITAVEHQKAYDKLVKAESGHDLLYYIGLVCECDEDG